MLGGYRDNLSLHEQYTFWVFQFTLFLKYRKCFSIRVTLFFEKLRPVAALHKRKTPPKGVLAFTQGDIVEDVRTVFEKINDTTIYIPALYFKYVD